MRRELQGYYKTISTVGEKVQAFVPAPLPPRPSIVWTPELRRKFDQAHYVEILNQGTALPERTG